MSQFNTFIGLIKAIMLCKLSMLYERGEFGNNINLHRRLFPQFLVIQLLLFRVNPKKLCLVLLDWIKIAVNYLSKKIL